MDLRGLSVLKHRNLRIFSSGLLVSRLGSEMQVVALTWQVYQLTHSAVSLGLIGLFKFLPILIAAPFAGMAADIIDRRKIIIVCQSIMALASAVLAFQTFRGLVTPELIYGMVTLHAFATTFDTPARQSIVPLLVPREQLVNAVGLNTTAWQISSVVGPCIGGFVIDFFGITPVYVIDALSYAALVAAVFLIKPTPQEINPSSKFSFFSFMEGLRFILKTPLLYGAMLVDFFATFFGSATNILPVFADQVLKIGASGLGLLYAAPSIGGIIAGVCMSMVEGIKEKGQLLLGSVIVFGLATIFFGLSTNFTWAFIFLALTGGADIVSTVLRGSLRQLTTPDNLRGRVVSINMIFFSGGPQLGQLEAGLAAAWLGAPASIAIGGLGAVISTMMIAKLVPQLREWKH